MPFLVIRRRQPHYPPPIRDDGSSPVARRGVRLFAPAITQARTWRLVGHRQPWLVGFPYRDGVAEPKVRPALVLDDAARLHARLVASARFRLPLFTDLPKEAPPPPSERVWPLRLVEPVAQAALVARRRGVVHQPFPFRDGVAEPRTFPSLILTESAVAQARLVARARFRQPQFTDLPKETPAAPSARTWPATLNFDAAWAQVRARRPSLYRQPRLPLVIEAMPPARLVRNVVPVGLLAAYRATRYRHRWLVGAEPRWVRNDQSEAAVVGSRAGSRGGSRTNASFTGGRLVLSRGGSRRS